MLLKNFGGGAKSSNHYKSVFNVELWADVLEAFVSSTEVKGANSSFRLLYHLRSDLVITVVIPIDLIAKERRAMHLRKFEIGEKMANQDLVLERGDRIVDYRAHQGHDALGHEVGLYLMQLPFSHRYFRS